jgi:Protein of unknown function (DUF2490)
MKNPERLSTRKIRPQKTMIMMMMIRKWLPAFLVVVLPLAASAQNDDFGIWYSANMKVGVSQKIDAEVSAELRTFENAGKTEQGFLEAGVEYKITDYLSVEPSYRLTRALEDDSKYYFQHKAFLDLKGNFKAGRFTFQGRFRFQARIRTYLEEVEDKYPDYTGRVRIKAIYRTQSFPLNPYIYAETFIPLNKEPERFIGKNRFAAGVEYKFSKKHSVDAAYIFQRDFLPRIANEHVLNIGYNFKF